MHFTCDYSVSKLRYSFNLFINLLWRLLQQLHANQKAPHQPIIMLQFHPLRRLTKQFIVSYQAAALKNQNPTKDSDKMQNRKKQNVLAEDRLSVKTIKYKQEVLDCRSQRPFFPKIPTPNQSIKHFSSNESLFQ